MVSRRMGKSKSIKLERIVSKRETDKGSIIITESRVSSSEDNPELKYWTVWSEGLYGSRYLGEEFYDKEEAEDEFESRVE